MTNTFDRRIQLGTDAQLRSAIESSSYTPQQQSALIAALHARESAHLASETLAFGCAHWTEINSKHYASIDTTPTEF
ncbi:hypothetical protein ACFWAY_53550 [Rhodococcus sp. NPDC059968]|uniref:hypothetical protein n=1 Tax=Rhodococcus sp. NPDC059968 TaxID=3347017 RepID=UPI003672FDA9